MNDYFTASLNLNHYNIIQYMKRPFDSTDEMNNIIIDNINKIVSRNDRLYIVGDFLFGSLDLDKFVRTAIYFRKKINCLNLYLIYGNHDRRAKKDDRFLRLFNNSVDYMEIKSKENQSIILFHYPIKENCWNRCGNGAWHLHGSIGNNICTPTTNNNGGKSLDVGIDNVQSYFKIPNIKDSYRPFSYNEIKEIMEKKN